MAITNFTELKTAVQDWLDDTSLATKSEDFIALAEARFNRTLRAQDMEVRVSLTVGGAPVDLIALPTDFLELREVHIEATPDEPLAYRSPQFVENIRDQLTGSPIYYSVETKNLTFAPQALATTVFSVLYFQKIPALTVGNPTNWLITNHPDVYLYGALIQAEAFLVNDQRLAIWKVALDEAMAELRSVSDFARAGGEPNTRGNRQVNVAPQITQSAG